jgi:glycosyltransferase involved in cell wall biosynthesis
MRILELAWEYPPHIVGGLGNHMAALAPALSRLGAEVTVVTPRLAGGDVLEEYPQLTIHRIEPPVLADDLLVHVQQTNVALDQAADALITAGGPFDVIHAHDWLVALSAIGLKHRHKLPLVCTIHATERGRGRGHLQGQVSYAIADTEWWHSYEAWRVITASHYMADELINYFGVPQPKIDVVPNGVDTRPFDALDALDLTAFRARYANPGEQLVFSVGRLVHEKGLHLLVEAAPGVLALQPGVKFVIAGTGPMLQTLRARVYELGIGQAVTFAGFITDEERNCLYKVADCAVFPSLYEPFGIVALEAMASRCPLVVASTGGLAEVVTHHETGITVYPGSVDSLADGILHVLKYPDWSYARVRNAYKVVTERYNWQKIAERTLGVLDRVVAERRTTDW